MVTLKVFSRSIKRCPKSFIIANSNRKNIHFFWEYLKNIFNTKYVTGEKPRRQPRYLQSNDAKVCFTVALSERPSMSMKDSKKEIRNAQKETRLYINKSEACVQLIQSDRVPTIRYHTLQQGIRGKKRYQETMNTPSATTQHYYHYLKDTSPRI